MERIFLGIYLILLRLPLFQCHLNRVKNKAHIKCVYSRASEQGKETTTHDGFSKHTEDINRTPGSMTRIRKEKFA